MTEGGGNHRGELGVERIPALPGKDMLPRRNRNVIDSRTHARSYYTGCPKKNKNLNADSG